MGACGSRNPNCGDGSQYRGPSGSAMTYIIITPANELTLPRTLSGNRVGYSEETTVVHLPRLNSSSLPSGGKYMTKEEKTAALEEAYYQSAMDVAGALARVPSRRNASRQNASRRSFANSATPRRPRVETMLLDEPDPRQYVSTAPSVPGHYASLPHTGLPPLTGAQPPPTAQDAPHPLHRCDRCGAHTDMSVKLDALPALRPAPRGTHRHVARNRSSREGARTEAERADVACDPQHHERVKVAQTPRAVPLQYPDEPASCARGETQTVPQPQRHAAPPRMLPPIPSQHDVRLDTRPGTRPDVRPEAKRPEAPLLSHNRMRTEEVTEIPRKPRVVQDCDGSTSTEREDVVAAVQALTRPADPQREPPPPLTQRQKRILAMLEEAVRRGYFDRGLGKPHSAPQQLPPVAVQENVDVQTEQSSPHIARPYATASPSSTQVFCGEEDHDEFY